MAELILMLQKQERSHEIHIEKCLGPMYLLISDLDGSNVREWNVPRGIANKLLSLSQDSKIDGLDIVITRSNDTAPYRWDVRKI